MHVYTDVVREQGVHSTECQLLYWWKKFLCGEFVQKNFLNVSECLLKLGPD